MGAVDDLRALGYPVDDPVAVARGIGFLILTRDQKASLLQRYLSERGGQITPVIAAAASSYLSRL